MSSDEDDYLSDKFLVAPAAAPSAPKPYAELRRLAHKRAQDKDIAGRTKSVREREHEAREEGLGKTLFERAEEETNSGGGSNKALEMMKRMGFKPGQALGQTDSGAKERAGSEEKPATVDEKHDDRETQSNVPRSKGPLLNPLPLSEWAGKQGIGVSKRAAEELERAAKVARVAQEQDASSFRERTRGGFEARRAEGRLGPAQRTCMQLDEREGLSYNVLWLNSESPDVFPAGLWKLVVDYLPTAGTSREAQLRRQMRADALQPLREGLDDIDPGSKKEREPDPIIVDEALRFLQLDPVDRLARVLDYLRERYSYCFWCGAEYNDEDDLAQNCPGPDEDMHD